MDPLELASLKLACDEQPSEQLPVLATEALVRGVDSPLLREAAGASTNDPREARETFVAALDELGIPVPERSDAILRLVREVAAQIVGGTTTPHDGASWLRQAVWRVEREGDLRIFIGLESEREDHPEDAPALDRSIIEEARALLARPELRRWVMLKAEKGTWPLWNPNPRRRLHDAELPISATLHRDITTWARGFDAETDAANPGPAGFKNSSGAKQFAERGRLLVDRLQAELGDDWHVEYWPNQVAFPQPR